MAHEEVIYPIFFDNLGLVAGRPAPAERLPEAHHRDARRASGANEEEVVFGAFEHSNAHFHAEIGRRIG